MAVPWYNDMRWMEPSELDREFYAIRVETDRALDDEQARALFGLIGYAFRQHFRGEPMGQPERINEREWAASYDITKSASDDWFFHIDDAIAAASDYAINGTPRRKTNRGGPVGSQLAPGLGPISLEIWFA